MFFMTRDLKARVYQLIWGTGRIQSLPETRRTNPALSSFQTDFESWYRVTTKRLATGRQPGTFSENPYGKSCTKIWILKRGGGQWPGWRGLLHMSFPKNCPVAFLWSEKSKDRMVELSEIMRKRTQLQVSFVLLGPAYMLHNVPLTLGSNLKNPQLFY